MKKLIILLAILLLTSCNNYKIEELYGSWTSDKMDLTLNKDKSMLCRLGPEEIKGRYNTFGNSLELIGPDNEVIGSVAIKSLKNDTLTLDLIQFSSNLITLVRKKAE